MDETSAMFGKLYRDAKWAVGKLVVDLMQESLQLVAVSVASWQIWNAIVPRAFELPALGLWEVGGIILMIRLVRGRPNDLEIALTTEEREALALQNERLEDLLIEHGILSQDTPPLRIVRDEE